MNAKQPDREKVKKQLRKIEAELTAMNEKRLNLERKLKEVCEHDRVKETRFLYEEPRINPFWIEQRVCEDCQKIIAERMDNTVVGEWRTV